MSARLRCPDAACKGHRDGKKVKPGRRGEGAVYCNACHRAWSLAEQYAQQAFGRVPDASEKDLWAQVFRAMEDAGQRTPMASGDVLPAAPAEPPRYLLEGEEGLDLLKGTLSSDSAKLAEWERDALTRMGIGGHRAVRVWTPGRKVPESARVVLSPWLEAGYRLVIPLVDHQGVIRSVKLRAIGEPSSVFGREDKPKTAHIKGDLKGLMSACPLVRRWLAGQGPQPDVVVWCEGEKDYAAALSKWAPGRPSWGFVGIFSGSMTAEWAARLAPIPGHVLLTDPDGAGNRYAREVVRLLDKAREAPAVTVRAYATLWYQGAGRLYAVDGGLDKVALPDVADAIRDGVAPATLPDPLAEVPEHRERAELDTVLRAIGPERAPNFEIGADGALYFVAKPDEATCQRQFLSASTPAVLARTLVHLSDGTTDMLWTVGAKENGRLLLVDVQARLSGDALAAALAGAGLTVERGRIATQIGTWLTATAHAASHLIPLHAAVTACGWTKAGGALGFLCGERWIGPPAARVKLLPRAKTAGAGWAVGVRSKGTLAGQLRALAGIRSHPVPSLALLVMAAGPVADFVGITETAIVFLVAPSQLAKTLAAQIGLSAYADPSDKAPAFLQWRLSLPGLESCAQTAQHLGLLIDDTATAQQGKGPNAALDKARYVAEVAYQIARGVPRATATANLGDRWNAYALATAEHDPLLGAETGALTEGAEKRIVRIAARPWSSYTDPSGDVRTPALRALLTTLSDGLADHHGHLVPAIAERLLQLDRASTIEEWRRVREYYLTELQKDGHRFDSALAQLFATLHLTQRLIDDIARAEGVTTPLRTVAPRPVEWLGMHLAEQLQATGDTPGKDRLWPAFVEWLFTLRHGHGPIVVRSTGGRPMDRRNAHQDLGLWEPRGTPLNLPEQEPILGPPGRLHVQPALIQLWLSERHIASTSPQDLIRRWSEEGHLERGPGVWSVIREKALYPTGARPWGVWIRETAFD